VQKNLEVTEAMQALVNERDQLEINAFQRLQLIQVSQHRYDVLVPRRSMCQSDDGIEHRLMSTEL